MKSKNNNFGFDLEDEHVAEVALTEMSLLQGKPLPVPIQYFRGFDAYS